MQLPTVASRIDELLEHGTCPCSKCGYELLPMVRRADDGFLLCSECGHETTCDERCVNLVAMDVAMPTASWTVVAIPSFVMIAYIGATFFAGARLHVAVLCAMLLFSCVYIGWISARSETGIEPPSMQFRRRVSRTIGYLLVNVIVFGGLMALLTIALLSIRGA